MSVDIKAHNEWVKEGLRRLSDDGREVTLATLGDVRDPNVTLRTALVGGHEVLIAVRVSKPATLSQPADDLGNPVEP